MLDPNLDLDNYDFELPAELIAQEPATVRDSARLLVLDRSRDALSHVSFRDIARFLRPNDLLIVNRTRVIPARLHGGRRETGGAVELLYVGAVAERRARVLLKSRGRLRADECIDFAAAGLRIRLVEKEDRGAWIVENETDAKWRDILDRHGIMPLPPYIKRTDHDAETTTSLDRERYQTVYAQKPGAIAAPTAGLHFTEALLRRLRDLGVEIADCVLHVGIGTFRPIEDRDVSKHVMHEERFEVPEATAAAYRRARERNGRVIAVGTTCVRCLETAYDPEAETIRASLGVTNIFIHPPHAPRSIDGLVTNFHLPRSTLLLLVSALAGRRRILDAYSEAIRRKYRFFSYGDAMLIL